MLSNDHVLKSGNLKCKLQYLGIYILCVMNSWRNTSIVSWHFSLIIEIRAVFLSYFIIITWLDDGNARNGYKSICNCFINGIQIISLSFNLKNMHYIRGFYNFVNHFHTAFKVFTIHIPLSCLYTQCSFHNAMCPRKSIVINIRFCWSNWSYGWIFKELYLF